MVHSMRAASLMYFHVGLGYQLDKVTGTCFYNYGVVNLRARISIRVRNNFFSCKIIVRVRV